MKMTIEELAKIVGGEPEGNLGHAIMGASNLEDAGENDVSFLRNPKLEPLLQTTKAGCVFIATERRQRALFQGNRIYVPNPQLAFARVLGFIEKETQPKRPPGQHPSAVISPLARLGNDVFIGPLAVVEKGAAISARTKIEGHCYIGQNVSIGEDCLMHPGVIIRENCKIGNRVILHSGVVIGSDGYGYVPTESGHTKIPQVGRVTIADDVEIGANTTVDRATTGETYIGEGTKIDNLVQIAHNVKTGKRCIIISQVGIAGSCELGNGVVLAGQVGLADHIKISDRAVIAAQSGVMQNIPEKAIHFGSPSRPHREAFKLQALFGKLPEMSETVKRMAKVLEDRSSTAKKQEPCQEK